MVATQTAQPYAGDCAAPSPRPTLSLELFPPRPGRSYTQAWGAIDRLIAAEPDFVSVTYRPPLAAASVAGPTTGPAPDSLPALDPARGQTPQPDAQAPDQDCPTRELITHLQQRSSIPAMAHLTCVGYTEAQLRVIIRRFLDAGVRRFLALRGDIPAGMSVDDVPGGLRYAEQLVRLIRDVEAEYLPAHGEREAVRIAVATYPAAVDHGREVEILAAKRAAGADCAITQVFYQAQDYAALQRAAQYSGVDMPIIPGIIPLTDVRRLQRLEALTGVQIPADLTQALTSDGVQAARAGIDLTLRLASELIACGAPGLHLYTFNRTRPALDVMAHVRLGGVLAGQQPDQEMQRSVSRDYLNAVPGTSA